VVVKLHLIRHPRPDIAPGICYGASDVPVPEAELARVHAALTAAGVPGMRPVVSSPLRRCAELARRLAPRSLRLDPRLAEMDFGAWELRPWDAIPRHEIDAWAADLLGCRPGGAENVLDVAHRVAAGLADLRDEPAGEPEVVVICHAGTIRLLSEIVSGMQTGVTLDEAALRAAQTPHQIAYGAVVTVQT
jgi:alpha-ribazole phosphatase